MKIRKFIPSLGIIFFAHICSAISPSVFNDGRIQFAISTVGGTPAFSAAEQASLVANQGGAVVAVVPTFYEIAVSTTLTPFLGNTEFVLILTSRQAAIDKIVDLETTRAAYLSLQGRYPGINVAARVSKLTAQIDLLVSLVPTIP